MKKFITCFLFCIGWHCLMAQDYYIPVVVHVMKDGLKGDVDNISPEQIKGAIAYLNKAYGKNNTRIHFFLAERKPDGSYTNGINTITNLEGNPDYVKGVDVYDKKEKVGINSETLKKDRQWDPNKYYNIWVVNKINSNTDCNGETSGFAVFPSQPNVFDGMVIIAGAMKSDSRVLPHEMGHALGLQHVFEGSRCSTDEKGCPVKGSECSCGDDGISDTQPVSVHGGERTGKPNLCAGNALYDEKTEKNWMSYVTKYINGQGETLDINNDDLLFSQGQIERMQETIETNCLRRRLAHLAPNIYCNPILGPLYEIGSALSKFDKQIRSVVSIDPNEKVGTTTNRAANHVNGATPFNYKIFFENKNTATAPAQEVVIVDTLDTSKFNLSTFQLQRFGYGGSDKASIPAGLTEYFLLDTLRRSGKPNLLIKTDAKLDTAKGILTWRFLSLDPQTNELVADPLDGFLPPNITSPQGEGYISYSVTPINSLPHATVIRNKAVIYFDNNAPIVTNEFLNTLDKVKPISRVSVLPVKIYDNRFLIKWSGSDADAGVRAYDIYYSINDGPFKLWQYDVSSDSSVFIGQYDSTYHFFSISKDNAGNVEDLKFIPEASTTITRGILPLQWAGIEAKLVLNNGVITWKTASESNSSHFDLERSIDRISFDNIAKILAAGNSNSLLAYDYTDRNIIALKKDKVYYRIKMVDKDGSFTYSNIMVINIPTSQLLVNVAPNPFGNSLRVIISSPKQQICRIEISDPIGRRVLTDSKNITSGSNILQYFSVGWKPGIYIVKIIPTTGISKTIKILKK